MVRVGLGHNIEDAVKRGFTRTPKPMSTKLNSRSLTLGPQMPVLCLLTSNAP